MIYQTSFSKRKKTDALVLPFFSDKKLAFSSKEFSFLSKSILKAGDFTGKKEQVVCHYPEKGKETRILLLGLGEKNKLTEEILRRSYAAATNFLKGKAKSVNFLLPQIKSINVTAACAEGVLLANYIFDANKSKREKNLSELYFIDADESELKKAKEICDSVNFTRNLVFSNADDVTPTFLGKMAKEIASEFKTLKATVWGRAEITKEKMGLLEAVSRGATQEPSFIILEYRGAPKKTECISLVGKGITYDTGGLNIKPTGGMETMRDDMSGGATILGTIRAAAALNLPINIVGVIGSTENAIGPKSYKPGDVYVSHAGITVEIANTDAEGRLVLADAISYVKENYNPKLIIDIATLTGGAIITFGEEVSALMSNDDALSKKLITAGERTYERVWRLPLFEEYYDLLKSKCADIKNSGVRKASSIQSAIFLQKFVGKTKWAHIDIAGTAFPEALKPYHPIQATGVGVRLLVSFLEHLS